MLPMHFHDKDRKLEILRNIISNLEKSNKRLFDENTLLKKRIKQNERKES
jgi:hypothetical protein